MNKGINNIQIITICVIVFCCQISLPLYAQTPLEKMNEIKMSSDYIWDEFTHPEPDSAYTGALKRLIIYMDSPQNREITIEDIKPCVKHIKMKRSTLTRIFAYIKKDEVNDIINKINSENSLKEKEVDVTKLVETEKQKTTPESKDSEKPGKKKKEKQKKEETPTKEVVPDTSLATDNSIVTNTTSEFSDISPVVIKIQELGDFYAVHDYLSNSKKDGTIQEFGSLKEAPNLNDCQLIIFNKQSAKLVGVLSTTPNGETRRNLTTGELDSLGNYSDGQHIAIWFK